MAASGQALTEYGAHTGASRLWMLRLVPNIRYGRWWTALVLFAVLFGWLAMSGSMWGSDARLSLAIATFFSVTVAYIVPVFHYIIARTEEALDALEPHLAVPPELIARLRRGISCKSTLWVAVNATVAVLMWLVQSWILSGGVGAMVQAFTMAAGPAAFAAAVAPLLVWLTTTCAVHGLIDNARLFRRLAGDVRLDVLNTRSLMPFGRMAVSSTLAVVGSLASLGIMWLGPDTDPWTTIPGVIPLTVALVYLFAAPVWPVHRRIEVAKADELARVQSDIDDASRGGRDARYLAPLLTYRREVLATPEWPFDVSILARLGVYLVIVPLTWIGAALIENLVNLFVE